MFGRRKKDHGRERQSDSNISRRSQTFSYYEARRQQPNDTVREPKSKARVRNWHWHQLQAWLLIIVVVGAVTYELILGTTPKVVLLNEPANVQINSKANYAEAAHKILAGSLSNSTKIGVNAAVLEASMKKQFPEIDSASLAIPLLGHQPVLYLSFTRPEAIISSQTQGNFLLTTNGTVLQLTKAEEKYLPTIIDQVDHHISVGTKILATSDINFIQQVASQLDAKHISIQSFVLPVASRELDVYIHGLPYFVKFNLQDSQNAGQQIGTFLATYQYLQSKNITPSQYVDARVLGRVYYK